MKLIKVLTTTPSRDEAYRIARPLVENGLAACAQISAPIESIYSWHGQIEMDTEYQLSIKTTMNQYDAIEKMIKDLHSYDVPQIIAVPIILRSEEYSDWVIKSTDDETSGQMD